LKFARRALDEGRWTGAWMIDLAADMEAIVDVWMGLCVSCCGDERKPDV
jgi:hypothetical protein